MTPIVTERLILKPLQIDDYESWFNGFSNRFPAQSPYDEGKLDMSICTADWFADLVGKHNRLRETDDILILAIFDKNHNHIGMIDVATLARANMAWGELGYFIHNQLWRQGFAFEALSALMPYLADTAGFHRIEAHVALENYPSQNLLKKLGFSFETVRKGFMLENNKWTNKAVFYHNLN